MSSSVGPELERTLDTLDAVSAASLERVIRDMLVFAQHRQGFLDEATQQHDASYLPGHFERLLGAWADLDFELPVDLPVTDVTDGCLPIGAVFAGES
ncbi:MAG: hypothetical protein ACI957_003994 [Verrucomicrobiales bacterium]|jgi:hypothetical protein